MSEVPDVCLSPTSPDDDAKVAIDSAIVATKRSKGQGEMSSDFSSVLNSKIAELEKGLSSGNPAEREAAKMRRKALRELQKYVTDKQNPLEDKIAYVQAKYSAQVTEFLKMEKHYLEVQRELELVTKERDKVQVELRKTNMVRDRLEELCRQLQRENREGLEESKRRQEEELKQRQALQLKFSQAIEDVTVKMDVQQTERAKQLEENDALRVKLGEVLQQFDSFTQLLNGKDLELQLAGAKLEQQQALGAQVIARNDLLQNANDSLVKMNEVVKEELEHHFAVKQQNALLQDTNTELKAQLESYSDKFSDFQSTLTKSNEMFGTLKKEIEATNKKRAQLTREREDFRKRSEKSDASLATVAEENAVLWKQMGQMKLAAMGDVELGEAVGGGEPVEEVRKLRLRKDRLEGLCRVLQAQIKSSKADAAVGGDSEASDTTATAVAGGSDANAAAETVSSGPNEA